MKIALATLAVLLLAASVCAQSDYMPYGTKGVGLAVGGIGADGGHLGGGASFGGFAGGLVEGGLAYSARGSHGNHTVSGATLTLGITPVRLRTGYAIGPKIYLQGGAGLSNASDHVAYGGGLVASKGLGREQRIEVEAHVLHVQVTRGGTTDTLGGAQITWLFKRTTRAGIAANVGFAGGLGDKRILIGIGVHFLTPNN